MTTPIYTDQQLLDLYRWCLANNAAGQTRTYQGRTVTFPILSDILRTLHYLEHKVASATYGTSILGSFN